MMSIAQSGLTVNFPYMLNEQGKHLAYIIARALGQGLESVEVSAEAESEWVDTILRLAQGTVGFSQGCTPGYYNNEGQPGASSRQGSFFFGEPAEFVAILESWRAEGGMKGLELR